MLRRDPGALKGGKGGKGAALGLQQPSTLCATCFRAGLETQTLNPKTRNPPKVRRMLLGLRTAARGWRMELRCYALNPTQTLSHPSHPKT